MKVAVVGATGLVGRQMLKVLEERKFPVTELIPVASDQSAGKEILYNNTIYKVRKMQDAIDASPEIALFSAGGNVSLEYAPEFAAKGTYVIDNSSAWRMNPDKKLVVPEINATVLGREDHIIANPNCSTIQLVMTLAPLHRKYGIRRVIVSTYQSITGTGMKAVRQFENERSNIAGPMIYPHRIDKNCLPHCDVFLENGYTKEEMKIVNETQKILGDYSIRVTSTAVRVPVTGGHSESVNIEFDKPFSIGEIREELGKTKGITVQDDPFNNVYPMPLKSEGSDEVFVGRIRKDTSHENAVNLWIVSDNLRKGAATNAVQIAEYVAAKFL